MKKYIIFAVTILIFTLSSCDSWDVSEEKTNEFNSLFLEYFKGDSLGDMYYYEIIDKSTGYTIEDDTIIIGDDYEEDIVRLDSWYTKDGFYSKRTSNDLTEIFILDTLYTHNKAKDTKTATTFDAENLALYHFKSENLRSDLEIILSTSYYDKYISSITAQKDPGGYTLIYTFNTDALIDDQRITVSESIKLKVTIDLEEYVYGFRFQIWDRFNAKSLEYKEVISYSEIEKSIPSDLEDYIID